MALGAFGVTASACIYRVPSRPAWNTPLYAAAVQPDGNAPRAAVCDGCRCWRSPVARGCGGHDGRCPVRSLAVRFLRCIASDSLELKGTARLLSTVLRNLVARGVLLAAGAIVLPLLVAPPALALALAGAEVRGRYLFFVSVAEAHDDADVPVESEAA